MAIKDRFRQALDFVTTAGAMPPPPEAIPAHAIEAAAPQRRARTYGTGGLMSGGIRNPGTGQGTTLDKSEGSFFTPTRIHWRTPLEVLGVESWVARKCLDVPNGDMFIRWRQFNSNDPAAVEAMEEQERMFKLEKALFEAMRAGDQYGTGVVVIVTGEAPLEEPLVPERIRPGDLKALHYFDRYDISVPARDRDFYSPNFGKPLYYQVHPAFGVPPMRVHHSRVLRFDGLMPPTLSGYTVYDQDFGVSVLIPILKSIFQDQTMASGISHAAQQFSIPVLHIAGLREHIAGGGDGDEASPAQIGAEINEAMSLYRLLMLDEPGREEFNRVAIAFAGLSDLFDKFPERVAMARDIPMTRFKNQSPGGMNATGDSDMKNYIMMLEAKRAKDLRDPLTVLDMVFARNAGLREPPEFEWLSLFEMSDKEIAEAAKIKAEALGVALTHSMIDEDEGREALNGDPVFGELSGPAPEPDPMEMMPPGGPGMNGSRNGNGASPRGARA